MEVEKTLRPGAPGTTKYLNRFGDRLVSVRHRIDRAANTRYTTVELIIDQRPCLPTGQRPFRAGPDETCLLRIEAHESSLQRLVRAHGGRWDRHSKTWLLNAVEVEKCALWDRVVRTRGPGYGQ